MLIVHRSSDAVGLFADLLQQLPIQVAQPAVFAGLISPQIRSFIVYPEYGLETDMQAHFECDDIRTLTRPLQVTGLANHSGSSNNIAEAVLGLVTWWLIMPRLLNTAWSSCLQRPFDVSGKKHQSGRGLIVRAIVECIAKQ